MSRDRVRVTLELDLEMLEQIRKCLIVEDDSTATINPFVGPQVQGYSMTILACICRKLDDMQRAEDTPSLAMIDNECIGVVDYEWRVYRNGRQTNGPVLYDLSPVLQ